LHQYFYTFGHYGQTQIVRQGNNGKIGPYSGAIKTGIFTPLAVVVCNKQTPVSSDANLSILISARDEPFMAGH
jgi:hypothetical protein